MGGRIVRSMQRYWIGFAVFAHLLLLTGQARFASQTPLYLDDLPPLASMIEASKTGHGSLIGLANDQLKFFQWQGRYQPVAAVVRYPPAFWLGGQRPAVYHLYTFAAHAAVLALMAIFIWQVSGSGAAILASTALFAAYPHTREAFLQFNSNGGVFESLFLLSALCAFVHAIRSASKAWYAVAFLAWGCALSSYEQSYPFFVLFPAVALIAGTPADRTLKRIAAHAAVFFSGVVMMQIAHALKVPEYSSNIIVNPSVLATRTLTMLHLVGQQAAAITIWDDRTRAWDVHNTVITFGDKIWIGIATAAFAAAMATSDWRRAARPALAGLLVIGILITLLAGSFMVFREGAGWYSRHHYTTAVGVALMHGPVLAWIAGTNSRWRAAVAAVILAFAIATLGAAQLVPARTLATWGAKLESIRQQLITEFPAPPPGSHIVILGDVIGATGWLASDAGVWFPRVWYERADLTGKMGNGDERFAPEVEGWRWLEPGPTSLIPYDRLLLFKLDGARLNPVGRLELRGTDGGITGIRLPSARPGALTERRQLDPNSKKTWTWNR